MSANFILEYAGAPVRFSSGGHELVSEEEATPFAAEYSAWHEVHRAGLNPRHCRVVNRYEANRKECRNHASRITRHSPLVINL